MRCAYLVVTIFLLVQRRTASSKIGVMSVLGHTFSLRSQDHENIALFEHQRDDCRRIICFMSPIPMCRTLRLKRLLLLGTEYRCCCCADPSEFPLNGAVIGVRCRLFRTQGIRIIMTCHLLPCNISEWTLTRGSPRYLSTSGLGTRST